MQAAFFLLAALASTSAVMALKSSESLSSIQNALQYSQGMAYVERTAFVGGQLGRVSSLNAGAAVSAPSAPLRVSFCPVAMEGGKNCMRMYPPSLRVTRWGGAQRSRQVVLHAGNPEQEPTPVEAEVVNDEVFDPLGLGGGAGASGDFDANLAQRNLWEAVKVETLRRLPLP
ncbi:hypothetical protein GUITHDRAFT_152744 [Guillardia theta CCMP2712]|uniref:Uncharacterized protein n=1 Tax=Guillardia theta (strain CCMP2712) TaxID=905079 RepID=L1J9B2_GUITC|nr:hypothetical protein GUITHDRAFT_152744 [Guillardia theta CCMP2712]EKX45143.1 hypothetical protein GUITHDRAFT_152744 [Guillardia theta CCMP2712]|eukprot:XP_005832123.1 hypothetical protein GUITHDRAFT_152744 [Guillardia theta CCMP2712]